MPSRPTSRPGSRPGRGPARARRRPSRDGRRRRRRRRRGSARRPPRRSASSRATNAFAPGHQVLLEEGAEVGAGARGPGDVGAADRVGGAGLGDRGLEGDLDAVRVQPLDDLAGAVDALLLGAVAGGRDLRRGRPSSRSMCRSSEYLWTQDISTAGTHSIPASAAAAHRLGTPATASWSVSDITVTPASAAALATCRGSSCPSDTVECA